jgi:hypothetical protein
MRIHEPLSHWNNFTLPELKEILEHCVALEKLGIAQDNEMMVSIERDIALRGKEESRHYAHHISKPKKQQIVQNQSNQRPRQQPQEYLLEQTA